MQGLMESCYDNQYYQQRMFQHEVKYAFFKIIAGTLVKKFSPKLVLDVGCAQGALVCAFNDLGVKAYGVDISEFAINQSPQSVRPALFSVDVDSKELPFEAQQFDMVTATSVIEHLQNYNHIICEMKRVLRPGGVAFITTPKKHWDIFFRIVSGGEPTHINVHSKSFWLRTFQSHGFHYMGDFPRNTEKEARHAMKNAASKVIDMQHPRTKIGQFLVRFGKVGRLTREELATDLMLVPGNEALLFRS